MTQSRSKHMLYRWNDRVLSFGSNRPLQPHQHGAAELVIALKQPLQCVLRDQTLRVSSLLIPPGVQHTNLHVDDVCPIIYLDAQGRDFQRLTVGLAASNEVYTDLPCEQAMRRTLQDAYRLAPNAEDCYALLQQAMYGANDVPEIKFDARIDSVIESIAADPAAQHSAATLAALVSLSTHRLEHLFKEQVGVPLHKFQLWMRLKEASRLYFAGSDLTTVAHATGFADAAHYSNTFKRFFGSSPSRLLKNSWAVVYFG